MTKTQTIIPGFLTSPINESDVTNLTTDLAAKLSAIKTTRTTFAATFTTTSATPVDLTGMTITLQNKTVGKAFLTATLVWSSSIINQVFKAGWVDNATVKDTQGDSTDVVGNLKQNIIPLTASLSGQACKIQVSIGGGATLSVYGTTPTYGSVMEVMEISN